MRVKDPKPCPFPGCPNLSLYGTHYCQGHHKQQRRIGEMRPLRYRQLKNTGPCKVPDCKKKASTIGMCAFHYQLVRGSTLAEEGEKACQAPGCSILHHAKGLCYAHYTIAYNMKRYGQLDLYPESDRINSSDT